MSVWFDPGLMDSFVSTACPLSGKADVQILVSEKSLRNDRYTLESGLSADTMMKVR